MNFKSIIKPQIPERKQKQNIHCMHLYALFDGSEKSSWCFWEQNISNKNLRYMFLNLGRVVKVSDHSNLKILTPKEMLHRLSIALEQVKVGNTSENLLNEIIHIIYSLY